MTYQEPVIGKRFGRLVATEYLGVFKYGRKFRFGCDCGNHVNVLLVAVTRRTRTPQRSCGCLRLERIRDVTGRFVKEGLRPNTLTKKKPKIMIPSPQSNGDHHEHH